MVRSSKKFKLPVSLKILKKKIFKTFSLSNNQIICYARLIQKAGKLYVRWVK